MCMHVLLALWGPRPDHTPAANVRAMTWFRVELRLGFQRLRNRLEIGVL